MTEIYGEMKNKNILENKKLSSQRESDPLEATEWKITLNGETTTYSIREFCDPASDTERILQEQNCVIDKMKNKEAYKNLPDAKGDYN